MIDTLSEIDLGIRIEDHKGRYVLRPYITGNTFWAHQALMNVKKMCEDELPGRYDLEVIDISHQLEPAREGRALAVLTTIRRHPSPLREPIGDLSDRDRVVASLEFMPDGKAGKEGNK